MAEGEKLACGHPTALLIRSTESDYSFCELCEARSERNDAQKMEAHYGERARELRAVLEGMVSAEEIVEHLHKTRQQPYANYWLDRARDVLRKSSP